VDGLLDVVDGLTIGGAELTDVVFSLLLATALGAVISQVYRMTNRGMNFELHFVTTLILLAPIVAVVMLFIRGDLVLSLGLIGSLSIIRFRTPIKDTRDMIFLFWTIAVGLGSGTFNWSVIIVATAMIAVLTLVVYRLQPSASRRSDYILVVGGDGYPPDALTEAVGRIVRSVATRSIEVRDEDWEVILELDVSGSEGSVGAELIASVRGLTGVRTVSLLAPQVALPV